MKPRIAFLLLIVGVAALAATATLSALASQGQNQILYDGENSVVDTLSEENPVEACLELASSFEEFPLLFLGESFEGHELRMCSYEVRAASFTPDGRPYHPGFERFSFVYGHCTNPPGKSCELPLTIDIEPICGPKSWGDEQSTVRGAPGGAHPDGDVTITNRSFRVRILPAHSRTTAADRAGLALRAAEALVPANSLAEPLRSGPLSQVVMPPDCPEWQR
jgi:hypothetical protein